MISTIFGIPGHGQNLPASEAELTMLQNKLRGEKATTDRQLFLLHTLIRDKKEAILGIKKDKYSDFFENQKKAYEIEKQIYVLEQIETELVNYNKLLEKELKQINSKIKTL